MIKDILGNRIEILPSAKLGFPDEIDWTRTKAYSFGYHGQIYINLKGREPQGIVSPGDEYERFCQEITERLKTLIDPEDGNPVVDQVIHRSQAFHGPAYDEAPDMVVIMRELSYMTRSGFEFDNQQGRSLAHRINSKPGSHRMEGILFLAGPDIRSLGYIGNQHSLPDLAPTALHLLGSAVPD